MKKIIILFFLLHSFIMINAQMTRWIMQPVYNRIYIADGAPIFVCDSANTYSLWNLNGKKLATTNDSIHPFREGYAITTKKGSNVITGLYNTDGKYTPTNSYTIAYPGNYFSDGYLLVMKNNAYRFINTEGKEMQSGYFVKIYPFFNGLATCFTYETLEKQKNPYFSYLTPDNQAIAFTYDDKYFENKDIQFLSSLSDEGKGIAVIKRKMYYFEKSTYKLEPIFVSQGETNIKKQVSVAGNIKDYIMNMSGPIIIKGKSGKTDNVLFYFDKLLRPTKIVFPDRTETFVEKEEPLTRYTSSLMPIGTKAEKFGLKYENNIILPPQFEEVGFCINNFAVVKSKGKWGMLTYDKDLKYRIIMHEGKDIAFRHKDVRTTIKLELPQIISANKCRFDVGQEYGCIIDKLSLETKNTENGNYVQYKCNLTIPDSLPDVITEIQYPVQITYDGLKYPIATIKKNAWHYKYINVDLDDSETTLEQGNVSFTINISVDKQPGENDYPFEVDIKTDSLRTELAKISETRYKCNIYSLAEGVNNVNISILENGCPPSVFPFEITYVKPVKRSKNKPEVKETVKIEKKVEARKTSTRNAPVLPV